MPALRLEARRVAKPWGRRTLWPGFADCAEGEEPVGEIWFEPPDGRPCALLVKWLFTGERLSIQVHPEGKDEAWAVVAADADATIALGPKTPTTRERLRQAALDGSIEALVDWRPVAAGESIYSPAGTIHAIGPGLTLVEVQQNLDVTYRLYDYGRRRGLHVDEAVAAASLDRFGEPERPGDLGDDRTMLGGAEFALERWRGAARRVAEPDGASGWFAPIAGEGLIDGRPWRAGECWLVDGLTEIELGDAADALFACPGAKRFA